MAGKKRRPSDASEPRTGPQKGLEGSTRGAEPADDVLEQEIAARRQAEGSSRLFRQLLDRSRDAIFIIEPETARLLDCNEHACRHLGYSRDELLNLSVPDVSARLPDAASWAAHIERVRAVDDLIVESNHRRKDGTLVPVEVSISYVRSNDADYLVAVARNTTERKRYEEELLRIQKLESIGFLAGGIAHDFNNLLQVILGNISLAKMYAKPASDLLEVLVAAERGVLLARDLSHRLLTFSNGGDPQMRESRLDEVVQSAVRFSLSGSNVACDFAFADDLHPVMVDRAQLTQVVSNLVTNAIEAMPHGGRIQVRGENVVIGPDDRVRLPLGDYARVSLKDHGVGIPEEHLAKVFDPYFSTKDASGERGSGLGLSICHSIIKKHGGLVTIDSQVGRGTTVHLYLPAIEEGAQRAPVEAEARPASKGRILVLDDEEGVRKTVARMARRLGYEVSVARNGVEALEIYKRAREDEQVFDAVILDMTIPGGMGGQEIIEELLTLDPGAKAIVSSGYTESQVLTNFRDYGFADAIAKPYGFEQLAEVLGRVVGR